MCHGDYFIEEESFATGIGKVIKETVKKISLNSLYENLNNHILSHIKIIKQSYFHQVSY